MRLIRSWSYEPFHTELSCCLFLAIVLSSSASVASVTFYSGAACQGYSKTFDYAWASDLTSVYYGGTSISMNNNISSMRIGADGVQWEVLLCNDTAYSNCARQLNMEGLDYAGGNQSDGRCVTFTSTGSWSSDSSVIPNNQASSFWIQPNSFDAYWMYYDFREDSTQSGDRYGYVELFTEENYRGMGYKFYSSDYDFADKPIKYNAKSMKIHGNLVSRLCLVQGDSCAYSFPVNDDRPFLPIVYGVKNLVAAHSSAMVMHSADLPEQASDFVDSFLNWGSSSRRDSYFRWAEGGSGTTHVVDWTTDDCYERCNAGNDNSTTADECSVDPDCRDQCEQNMCAYLERVNRKGYRWAGDSSLVFLGGHGNFNASSENATISMTCSGSCNPSLRTYSSREDPDWTACPYDWPSDDLGSDWGSHNTDWIITTACHSLGNPGSVDLVQQAASLDASAISQAWKHQLLSGVHGIGGFFGQGIWRAWPADDSGDDLASDFWSDLETKSFAQAWGEVGESFSENEFRVMYYMVACPLGSSDFQCVLRMQNDYFNGYQTGPQPDLNGFDDMRFHIEVYQP